MKTPELDKMQGNQHKSQIIGTFLEWLQNNHEVVLCRYSAHSDSDSLYPTDEGIELLLANYFGVDLKIAEKERQGLLNEKRMYL
ncbi:hypothetical protein LCGC14_0538780 [marine sediment metagenome]|uniref:Uncharacterized protein n=1 Tax=marine sediment metagenome TaxID=412755 RepID=A0A0F9V1R6_9ZZZZ